MEEWYKIINEIESEKYEYISFDIFDTLLVRPFWEPTDLFYFIGIYAKSLNILGSELEFMKIRIKAEEDTRLKQGKNVEDITLDEIYETMQSILGCNNDIEKLKNHEIELELLFCYRRQSGYELYCKAVNKNKKVICISDMYLREKDLQLLLDKNGYSHIEKIYTSSKFRLGKYTGNLYQHVLKDLGLLKRDKILHIGDNYHSDILMAQRNGLKTCYLAKAKDIYIQKEKVESEELLKYRIDKAIEVNTKYDNPFIENDYNSNQDIFDKIFENYRNYITNCNHKFIEKKQSIIYKLRRKIIKIFK